MHCSRGLLMLIVAFVSPWLVGCCCCCDTSGSFQMPEFDDQGDDGDAATDGAEAGLEMKNAREYAGKALAAKGYGPVKTADLDKEGVIWYVSGTAEGPEGEVQYQVMFEVTEFKTGREIRRNWAAKSVSVDGEVIYP